MAGDQTDNIQILDSSTPFLNRSIESTDNIQISATVELQNNVEIQGNLAVQGAVTSLEQEIVRIQDNHLFLNDGYTAVSAQTGGLVVNYLPTAITDTIAAPGYTAGIVATSNPTVATASAATYAAGDFILLSGATNAVNNGLFEVLSHAGNVLTIRGVGTSAPVEDFSQTQFATDSSVAGLITKITVSIMRTGPDGAWETGAGSVTPVSFTDVAGNSPWIEDEFTPALGQITFFLSAAVSDPDSFSLHVNGVVYDDTADYTVSGVTLTWLNTLFSLDGSDKLLARYQ